MKEVLVKIPDESSEFVTSLLQKLGVQFEETTTKEKKNKSKSISPTYLFGKWKYLEIDAKQLRNKAWQRNKLF